jgi:hypothetical protein
MSEDYEEKLHNSGRYCSIMILSQDGPICQEVYEITLNLLKIAEQCWNPTSLKSGRPRQNRRHRRRRTPQPPL